MKIIALTATKILLVYLLLLQPSYADKVQGLYNLSTPVANTSDTTRATAANQLLQQLLVRASGTAKVLEKMPPEDFAANPEDYKDDPRYGVWQELMNAQQLITQFSYKASNELLTLDSGDQVRAQLLELEFDPAGVSQLLRRLESPVWDINRPKTLFWIALEGRQGRYLVSRKSNQPLSDALMARASQRGIPVALPDPDVHSYPATLLSDIWGGFAREILEASQDYKPDAVAVARIQPSGNTWVVEWQLFTGFDSPRHRAAVATLGEALDEGVNFAAEELSSRYASQPGESAGTYRVRVSNVQSVSDYAELTRYLNALSLTSQVRVVQAQGQQLLLELGLRGGLSQFRANLALDGRMKEEPFMGLQQNRNIGDAASSTTPNQLTGQVDAYFRWQSN